MIMKSFICIVQVFLYGVGLVKSMILQFTLFLCWGPTFIMIYNGGKLWFCKACLSKEYDPYSYKYYFSFSLFDGVSHMPFLYPI